MGFTDEEVRESLRPRTVEPDEKGDLFDPDPVDPKPVLQYDIPDTPEARGALQEGGADYVPQEDGTLRVGIRGDVPPEIADTLKRHLPEQERAEWERALSKHRERVDAEKSPAERGAAIEVPCLTVQFHGDLFRAETDLIMERVEWSILNHPAEITPAELSFRRDENLIEIDIEGDRLVYHQTTATQQPLSSLNEPDASATEATLVQWLEGQCRARDIPQSEMTAWLAKLVVWMATQRGIAVRTMIDLQYPLATCIRAKINAIRAHVRRQWHQEALFGPDARSGDDPAATARFDLESYETVPTQPTEAVRLRKHLLGPSRVPLLDGNLAGEEFQCAWSLDGLDEVELWVRNLPKHRSSFWLPKAEGRFYPDFIARLKDRRIFVVEYKGAHLVGAPDEREKTLLGNLWARQTGNVFATVQKMLHGRDVAAQLRAAIAE